MGVDFSSKTLRFRGKNLKLQLWDSAGQEKYKSLIPSYIRGASIIFIVYDVTSNSRLCRKGNIQQCVKLDRFCKKYRKFKNNNLWE